MILPSIQEATVALGDAVAVATAWKPGTYTIASDWFEAIKWMSIANVESQSRWPEKSAPWGIVLRAAEDLALATLIEARMKRDTHA